jgi:hypothetical protein
MIRFRPLKFFRRAKEDAERKDPRDKHSVTWRVSDLFIAGLEREVQKEDWQAAREAGIHTFHDLFLPVTTEDLDAAELKSLEMIEDDSWDEESHEFDFKSQSVAAPVPGVASDTYAYRLWHSPDELVVRVRFMFKSGMFQGHYDKIQTI